MKEGGAKEVALFASKGVDRIGSSRYNKCKIRVRVRLELVVLGRVAW